MAETINEFLNDSEINDSNLSISAQLVRIYLNDNTISAAPVSQALISEFSAPDAPQRSEFIAQIIVPLAEQLSETHEPLVELLRELKDLSMTVQRQSRNNINIQGDSTITSSDGDGDDDLNTVGLSILYELQERSLRYGDPDPCNDLRDLCRDEWANLNRFAALVHKARLEDLSGWGRQTIRFAIRRGGWRVNWDGRWGKDALSDEIRAFEGHAVAASHWVLICGRRLYNEGPESRENWTAWVADLKWIMGQDGLNSVTKSWCQEALREMEQIHWLS